MKQGWEIKKLGDVVTFKSGYTPKDYELSGVGDVPYYKVSDMNHELNTKYLHHTSLFLKDGCKSFPKHSIVFPKNGAAIATNKKRILTRESVVDLNTGIICVSNPYTLNYEYLYLFIQNIDFRLYTRRGAVPTLDSAELKSLPIPVPPIAEQEKIVAELDCLSGIIEKKKQQLKELDNLAQSIFYEMFGDPVENNKGLDIQTLGDVAVSVNYGTSSPAREGGVFKYLRMNNLTYSGYLDLSDVKSIDANESEREKYSVQRGDILFNRTNSKELVGKTALFTLDEEMIIAGYIIRIRVDKSIVLPLYVVRYMNTPFMKSYFANLCKGAVNQANINSKELKSIPLPIPSLSLQQDFASKIEPIEKQKELISQSIKETETLFNSRMDYYFN